MKYLYNGVELPALPDWDKEKYPYAMLLGTGFLWVSTDIPYVLYGSVRCYCDYEVYVVQDGSFVYKSSGSTINVGITPFWSSVDIYYENSLEDVGGTLFLAASEPVPVTDHNARIMGWIVGKRLAAQRGRA